MEILLKQFGQCETERTKAITLTIQSIENIIYKIKIMNRPREELTEKQMHFRLFSFGSVRVRD